MKAGAPYGAVTPATPLVPQQRELRSRTVLSLAVAVVLGLTAAACVLGTHTSGSTLLSSVSHGRRGGGGRRRAPRPRPRPRTNRPTRAPRTNRPTKQPRRTNGPASVDVHKKMNGVGGWGGICVCPSGAEFQVGDMGNSCGSLACFGGTAKRQSSKHNAKNNDKTCGDGWINSANHGKGVTCAKPIKLFSDNWMTCYDTKSDGDFNKKNKLTEMGEEHKAPLWEMVFGKMDDSGCKEANERASCRCKADGSVPVPVTGNTKCGDQDKTCFVMASDKADETDGKRTVEYDLKRALHINGVSTTKVKFSYPVKLDSNGVNQYNDSTLGLRIKGGFECGGRFSGKVYGDEEKRVPKRGIMGTDSGIDPKMTKLAAALDKWMYAEEIQQCCVEHDYGYVIPGSSKAEVDINFKNCMHAVCRQDSWNQKDTDQVPVGDVIDPQWWDGKYKGTKKQNGRNQDRGTPFSNKGGKETVNSKPGKCPKSADIAYKAVRIGGMLTYTKGQACNQKCGGTVEDTNRNGEC